MLGEASVDEVGAGRGRGDGGFGAPIVEVVDRVFEALLGFIGLTGEDAREGLIDGGARFAALNSSNESPAKPSITSTDA